MTPFTRGALAATCLSAFLAACGGGSDTTLVPMPPPAPPTIPPSSLVTSVPPATYAPNSYERAVYDVIYGVRQRCGLGLLAQDTRLDLAAADHAHYLAINNVLGHTQEPGKPGFTGVSPTDRAAYRGYTLGSGEVAADGGDYRTAAEYRESFRISTVAFFSAAYHGMGLLSGGQHLGIGTAFGTAPQGWTNSPLVIDLGDSAAFQQPAGDQVLTYPCEGEVVIGTQDAAEIPNPFPGRDYGKNPVGQPIYVWTRVGYTLSDVVMDLRDGTGKQYPMIYKTRENDMDIGKGLIMANEVIGFADGDMPMNTAFRITITGKIHAPGANGAAERVTPFTKAFSFKTYDGHP